MKKESNLFALLGVVACWASVASAVPVVSDVTMSQALPKRDVTITYRLSEAPAVVTLDIETNAPGGAWVSIGGENVQFVSGAVNRKVTLADKGANDLYTINWKADASWPNKVITNGGARAKVTAWALDNTPDYMVVDVSASAAPGTERYYTSTNFLPGGVMNPLYRTSSILMRKILAKDVVWNMGTATEAKRKTTGIEDMHQAELTNNYYIGVFEVTQTQWALVQTERPTPSWFQYEGDRAMRPVERVCYNEIRAGIDHKLSEGYEEWPAAPYENSFLGLLRTKTGIDFDLPSDAEWEYACRAGHGEGHYGEGSVISDVSTNDSNLRPLARFVGSLDSAEVATTGEDTLTNYDTTTGATNGTAICGSYLPNSWGLYDTLGNVSEWVVDCYSEDRELLAQLRGAVNTNIVLNYEAVGSYRIERSGRWNNQYTANCRPSFKNRMAPDRRYSYLGFRLACRNGLK